MAGTDYGDSLRSTLDAARKQILDLGQDAAARRQQAALTLGHAEQALSVAENTFDRTQRDLANAHVIHGVAVQGGALIQSAEELADLAKAESDGASSALSTAATSIRTLAGAFDTLAKSIAGVHAIASNDDAGSAMARAAERARTAVNDADRGVEQLKAASLTATIESARSITDSTATAVQAVGVEIQDLVDRAGALFDATQQRMTGSTKQRAAAAQAERAAQTTYHRAKIDSEAFADGTITMDRILNGGLEVTATAPVLNATYKAPFDPDVDLYAFAMLEDDMPGFSFLDAKTLVESGASLSMFGLKDSKATPAPKEEVSYTAAVTTTTAAAQIAPGQSYRVFVFRVPRKGGVHATNASDLSYPSRTIEVKQKLDLSGYRAQRVTPPPPDPRTSPPPPPTLLKVEITPPKDTSALIEEYRAFVLLEDVYQAVRHDEEFVLDRFPSSSYLKLPDPENARTLTDGFVWPEGATDAYGDIITTGTNYEVLVIPVPKDTNKMKSEIRRVPLRPSAPPPDPAGPASPVGPMGPARQDPQPTDAAKK